MRVYIPATLPLLARIAAAGEVASGSVAYAVTPALREWYPSGDAEELEYAAMTEAARDSLRQLAAEPDTHQRRRVVIAADVPDTAVRPLSGPVHGGARGAVRVAAATAVRRFASVHVDGDGARADIEAALGAVTAAAARDEEAQFLLDTVEGHELLWYTTQEIPDLLRLG